MLAGTTLPLYLNKVQPCTSACELAVFRDKSRWRLITDNCLQIECTSSGPGHCHIVLDIAQLETLEWSLRVSPRATCHADSTTPPPRPPQPPRPTPHTLFGHFIFMAHNSAKEWFFFHFWWWHTFIRQSFYKGQSRKGKNWMTYL